MAAFLFDPDRVAGLLTTLPALKAGLGHPEAEGRPSNAYPDLRETRRAVYRLLANPHYPHLRDGLRAIERTLAIGCGFDVLLTTREPDLFVSHMSEVRAADHLLARGFAVASVPRGAGKTPDLRVVCEGQEVSIEVYTPRDWIQAELWKQTLKDEVMNLDINADFLINISTSPSGLEAHSPWELDSAIATTGPGVKASIIEDVREALTGRQPLHESYSHASGMLTTTVELTDVKKSSDRPRRWMNGPSLPGPSGYSPSGMLARLVEGPVVAKAGRRQTGTSGLRGLVVDISLTGFAHDLDHPSHGREAFEAVRDRVDPFNLDLDFLVLYRPSTGRSRGRCSFMTWSEDDRIPAAEVAAMFGAPQPPHSRRVPGN